MQGNAWFRVPRESVGWEGLLGKLILQPLTIVIELGGKNPKNRKGSLIKIRKEDKVSKTGILPKILQYMV